MYVLWIQQLAKLAYCVFYVSFIFYYSSQFCWSCFIDNICACIIGAMQIISLRVCIIFPLLPILAVWGQAWLFIFKEAFSRFIYSRRYDTWYLICILAFHIFRWKTSMLNGCKLFWTFLLQAINLTMFLIGLYWSIHRSVGALEGGLVLLYNACLDFSFYLRSLTIIFLRQHESGKAAMHAGPSVQKPEKISGPISFSQIRW